MFGRATIRLGIGPHSSVNNVSVGCVVTNKDDISAGAHIASLLLLLSPLLQGMQNMLDHCSHFGRPFVKRFARCYRAVVCNVGVLLLNDSMDQDETWHGGRPRPTATLC